VVGLFSFPEANLFFGAAYKSPIPDLGRNKITKNMISWIIFILGLAVAGFLFYKRMEQKLGKSLPLPIGIFVLVTIVAIIQPLRIERIDAGAVGLKFNMVGGDQGVSSYEYKSGWCLYNTWFSKVIEIPTFQQHVEYDAQEVITKGGFRATIKPSFNYAPVPTTVGDMYVSLRKPLNEVEQGWLKNAIVGSVNDVANKWKVDSIFNDRERFESAIVAECNDRVSKWFAVSQLRTNIVPPPALQKSIEAKTRAVQEVQVAESQKLVAVADAQRKIAVARGDSAQAVIAASGRAEAIRREQLNLTPMYLEYIRASNWDGKLPSTVLSSGQNLMVPLK
jgi:regulator of protease activity HflC (stomatin/prohibitin superfamily)